MGFSSSPLRSDRLWSPPSFLCNGFRGYFTPRVKLSEREADHSPATNADVSHAWCLVNHRVNFTCLPYLNSNVQSHHVGNIIKDRGLFTMESCLDRISRKSVKQRLKYACPGLNQGTDRHRPLADRLSMKKLYSFA
jgi:hypothetical protein